MEEKNQCLQSFISLFLLLGFALIFLYCTQNETHALRKLQPYEYPSLLDDLDPSSLILACQQHLSYLRNRPANQQVKFAKDRYNQSWLIHSFEVLHAFLLSHPSTPLLQSFLRKNYFVYQAGGYTGYGNGKMLVTGYYQPEFEGSMSRRDPFIYPIYSLPPPLEKSASETDQQTNNRPQLGNSKGFFFSRETIESDSSLLAGNELAYLKDPFDIFLLHVQGSGLIRLCDGSIRAVRFAGSNGREYKSIGKLMVEEKLIPRQSLNIPAIREYFKVHPNDMHRILQSNPRFIFFSWGDDALPRGSIGEPLTAGRSIAIDRSILPDSALGFLVTRYPQVGEEQNPTKWVSINRLVLPQDSGAAIKGSGRVDMFLGRGRQAEFAASYMKEKGKLYFLVLKPSYRKSYREDLLHLNR